MKKPTKARRTKKTDTVDLYQKVTDRIVEALEKGVAPWKKPWRTTHKYAAAGPLPVNASTGRAYSGVIWTGCAGTLSRTRSTRILPRRG